MILNHGICHLTLIPLRETPTHKAQMVSQLLFGEIYTVLETERNWLKIKVLYDNYEGWIDSNQHQRIDFLEAENLQKTSSNVVCLAFAEATNVENNNTVLLPFAANLPVLVGHIFTIAGCNYQVNAHSYLNSNSLLFSLNLEKLSRLFLNTPYLWGGKSRVGVDCSGFTQIIFKVLGIKLFRDAWQQAQQGQVVDFLETAQLGDLAFFDNPEGKITHVGILISNCQIIHASGYVKINRIDNYGIFCEDINSYTHKLRILKRMV